MLKLAMSPGASAVLRGLLDRAGAPRDRILLSHVRSVDWQSLTFVGERHEILAIANKSHRTLRDVSCKRAMGWRSDDFAKPLE